MASQICVREEQGYLGHGPSMYLSTYLDTLTIDSGRSAQMAAHAFPCSQYFPPVDSLDDSLDFFNFVLVSPSPSPLHNPGHRENRPLSLFSSFLPHPTEIPSPSLFCFSIPTPLRTLPTAPTPLSLPSPLTSKQQTPRTSLAKFSIQSFSQYLPRVCCDIPTPSV